MDLDLDLDAFGTVVESEEDDFSPSGRHMATNQTKQKFPKTLKEKREEFRIQIRQEKTDELFNNLRMPYLARKPDLSTLPTVQVALKQLEACLNNTTETLGNLQTLAKLTTDENRINSIFLIKHHFLTFITQLLSLNNFQIDEWLIVTLEHMSQDKEFVEQSKLSDIYPSVERGYQLLLNSQMQPMLAQTILQYFGNISRHSVDLRDYLLQLNILVHVYSLSKSIHPTETLSQAVIEFVKDFSINYPEAARDKMAIQYLLINQHLENRNRSHILASLQVINRQATHNSMEAIAQTTIISFLMEILQDQDYDDFYFALLRIKEIAMSNKLPITQVSTHHKIEMLIQHGILDIVDQFIYHKYQKLRTASLYIVMSLCHSSHEIIMLVLTNSIIQKLINVLVTDKPVNKSLVLETIINILTYGKDPVYSKLLDLGIIKQLPITLDTGEAQILIQGIKCSEILLEFGQHQMSKYNLSSNPILQRMNECNLIKVIEGLQKHENQEVFNQASQFLQTFFEFEHIQ